MIDTSRHIAVGEPVEDVLGQVSPPPGVTNFNTQITAGAGESAIGIVLFASNMLKLATVIAGIWVLFNFVTAAFDYITAGDSKAHSKVKDKLTTSVLGLVIIVSAYTIAAIIGLVIFGNPGYILNPQICGPDTVC